MTTEQQKEVKVEEKATEQTLEEKGEVTEQVATLEPEQPEGKTPEGETTSDAIGTLPQAEQPEVEEKLDTKEKLAAEVKTKLLACAEENGCIDALLGRFEQVASKLGIPTDKLIDQVFALLKGEKIES